MEYKIGFCSICGRALKVSADSGTKQSEWDDVATEKCKRSRDKKGWVKVKHENMRGRKPNDRQPQKVKRDKPQAVNGTWTQLSFDQDALW